MIHSIKKIATILFLSGTFGIGFSQAQDGPLCYYSVMHEETPALLAYLFEKYGVEHSEAILLNVQEYEAENDVKVLHLDRYTLLMKQLNHAIQQASGNETATLLLEKKAKLVLFTTIEHLVNH